MALGAWKPIAVSSAVRAVACIHNDIHYSMFTSSTSVINRIDCATDTPLAPLTLSATIPSPRSLIPIGSLFYVGTFNGGIWSVDIATGVTTQIATVAQSTAHPLIAHVIHGGKIHWFSYQSSAGGSSVHVTLDPTNPMPLTIAAIPNLTWATAQLHGNRAIVLADSGTTALVVDF